jgi:hypothetical protein
VLASGQLKKSASLARSRLPGRFLAYPVELRTDRLEPIAFRSATGSAWQAPAYWGGALGDERDMEDVRQTTQLGGRTLGRRSSPGTDGPLKREI